MIYVDRHLASAPRQNRAADEELARASAQEGTSSQGAGEQAAVGEDQGAEEHPHAGEHEGAEDHPRAGEHQGTGEHPHTEEHHGPEHGAPLGPIDWPFWAAAIVGVGAGLAVIIGMYVATTL
jgi:ABC-type Zn2+ transport system substrate-binding protein/surface adhesin